MRITLKWFNKGFSPLLFRFTVIVYEQ